MINLTQAKPASYAEIRKLKTIASYQFSSTIADCLFPPDEKFFIQYSIATNKIRNILDHNLRLFLVLRAQDYLFSLTEISGQIIKKCSDKPKFRFVVLNDISQFIKEGRNVFCKFVLESDESIRAGDEVLVVNEDDELLAIGRARVSGEEVKHYKRGIAVIVKREVKDE
jgi:uncharacterized protein with predicted RNA binding PUA domain